MYGELMFIICCLQITTSREVIWETSLGTLRGHTKTSLNGFEYYAFEGIPYAEPPIGDLRFKAPVPAEPWKGVLNATNISPHCIQIAQEFPSTIPNPESEDCLYLNIYTRKLGKQPKSDILIVVYGGMFQFGSVMQIGPEFLMDHDDLIFINFNYRSNIFGFLSFYDPTLQVPGNAGGKDAVLMLQWVQKYIHEFGGDPTKVTISGCSTGGQLIQLLSLHPTASKLFRHAILSSGTILLDHYKSHEYYEMLAYYTNYTGSIRNERAFLNHLRQIPAQQLLKSYLKYSFSMDRIKFRYALLVTIESKINNPNPFLTEAPDELILKGKFARIPYLGSFVQFEGGVVINRHSLWSNNYTYFTEMIPIYLKKYFSRMEFDEMSQKIKTFYFGNETPNWNNRHTLSNVYGDSYILYPNLLSLKTMAQVSNYQIPIYIYEFNIRTALNALALSNDVPEPFCSHCDEIGYGFSRYIDDINIQDLIKKPLVKWGIATYTNMLMNFIRTGNPNSFDPNDPFSKFHWKPIRSNNMDYIAIQPNITLDKNPFRDRMKFWHGIYNKYLSYKNIPQKIYTQNLDLFP